MRPYIHPVLFGLFRWFPVQQLSEFGSSEFGRTLVSKAKNGNAAAEAVVSQGSVQAELKPKTLLLFGSADEWIVEVLLMLVPSESNCHWPAW